MDRKYYTGNYVVPADSSIVQFRRVLDKVIRVSRRIALFKTPKYVGEAATSTITLNRRKFMVHESVAYFNGWQFSEKLWVF
jgi:hypothetical protein